MRTFAMRIFLPGPRAERVRHGGARAVVLCSTMILLCGCQTLPHTQAKQHAEQRWSEVRARVKYQLGKQQFDGGLFQDAVSTLAECVTLDSQSVEAYVLLALANLELSKPASAEQAIFAAQSFGLESADLHYVHGVILEQRDRIDDALAEFERARELDPASVDYLVAQAECLVARDRPDEALRLLEENMNRFDDDATIATLAAHVAVRLGDVQKASAYFARASISAGGDPRTLEPLALLLARQGRCAQAIPILRTLVEGEGHASGAVCRALARCYLSTDHAAAAVELLAEYSASNPDADTALILLAQASLESGDLPSAMRAIDRARLRRPNDPDVLLTLAAIQWRRGEYPLAADGLYSLLERDPNFPAAFSLLAEVLAAQNQPREAQDCVLRAAALRANPQ